LVTHPPAAACKRASGLAAGSGPGEEVEEVARLADVDGRPLKAGISS
jgi:hypothetical protein